MTNQDTKKAFAEIIAKAQALAEQQNGRGKVTYTKPEPQPKPEPKPQPELSTMTIDDILQDTAKPSLTIINYSDKAIVVVGDTYANRVKLRSLGGKYNKWLKCGEGWVFPKTMEARIKREFAI
jgi:hypothetical protein